jgi:DNA replication protein
LSQFLLMESLMKSTDDLVRIAAAGGGLDLRNAGKSTNDLVRIAAAASGNGARIMINGNKSTDDLVRIAAAGGGCVVVYFGD